MTINTNSTNGRVILVGAGPGDPGLISVKGAGALRRADTVVYDHLISKDLLNYTPKQCQMIYVGKIAGKHTMPQELINQLLVDEAREGKTVVRLKGGDPFIFGRGGEECLFLKENGIEYEVVPGISATSAVAAHAGIPLTHRRVSTSYIVLTGHEPSDPGRVDVNWKTVAEMAGTLVIFMGVKTLPQTTAELIKYGRDPHTPVAVIRWGTMPEQQTIVGTLETIAEQVEEAGLKPPGLIVVGEVVRLREKIKWFEQRPLFGVSAVIPRTHQRPSEIGHHLQEQGAAVFEFTCPTVHEEQEKDNRNEMVRRIREFNWLFFTDTESVSLFLDALLHCKKDARHLADVHIAALNDEIAERLNRFGIYPEFVTNRTCTPPLVKEFAHQFDVEGQRICLFYDEHSPDKLREYLDKRKATVRMTTIYDPQPKETRFPELHDKKMDLLVFLSVKAVEDFFAHADQSLIEKVTTESRMASVSPLSSQALRDRGLEVHIEPEQPITSMLLQAILESYSKKEVEATIE